MDLTDLAFLKLINRGGSGNVYLVWDRIEKQHLALKVMPKRRELNTVDNILNERYIHSFLSFEDSDDQSWFLPLVASWHDEVNFYIATEYLPGGDLESQLTNHTIFTEERARFYACEIILALEQLHARKIIHRDLKPANILLKPDGHVVLSDFGISRQFFTSSSSCSPVDTILNEFKRTGPSSFLTSDDCGTPHYMTPEQHLCDKYSFEVDYWALGVILYRMLTGQLPFGQEVTSKQEVAISVVQDELKFPETVCISLEAREFIQSLLVKSPGERIRVSEIKKHPFFIGVNWKKISKCQLPISWKPTIPSPLSRGTRLCRVHAITILPFQFGRPFEFHSDPLPEFTWYRPPSLYCPRRCRMGNCLVSLLYLQHNMLPRTCCFSKLIRPFRRGLGSLFSSTKGTGFGNTTREKRG
ncbi:kinase-like protein [Dendrothele bispora CBS 962.96]|uniref:non-specific serine/threonine protein kinase n=1 Tax=Dendrothele bispora (strain CBS 962.96) TaxID=1314807 RepID=A0A4V4HDB0_DENBC|nr:kinase-like protein [Dendrothele bispora CBS 962.96]